MRSVAGWRWVRLGGGTILALFAALAAPSPLQASCGDYVVIVPTKVDRAGHRIDLMKVLGLPHSRPSWPMDHRLPCRGPHCSRGSQPPLTPVVPPRPPQTQEWACGICWRDGANSPLSELLPAPSLAQALRRSLSVYHPPRLSV